MASATGLGLVVSFEPTGETDAESSGRIWGGGEAGTSFTRVMNIQSLSTDTVQQISFEINDQVTENDTSFIDYSAPSRITDWIVFEPAKPLLNPGESVQVTITFNIPAGTSDGAFNANIRTLSSAAFDPDAEASDAGTQAVIGTRLALDARVWLGVGDALALAPKFDIAGVDGALINEEKFVRVFFENTGISPVAPVGRFQLSDPNFVDRVFEPVDFKMPEIRGGEVAFTDIPVASDLEDGFFRVFVTAQSGEVRITRLFEANLVFDDPNKLSIPDLALRIGGFVLAALGLVFGVRLIRGGKTKEKSARKPRSKSRRLPSNQPVPTPPEESLEALQAAIARMEQQFQELNKELAAATKPPAKRKAPAKAKTAAPPKPVSSTTQTAKKAAAKPAPKRAATASAKRTPARATAKAPAKPTVKKVAATKSLATPVKAKPAVAKPRARATSSKPATKKTEG
jgi:hypothetical protein